jgi:4-carboxymuconolactone decarboxylase
MGITMNHYDRSQGQAKFDEVYGSELAPLPPAGASPFIDYMPETLFGVLWSDPALSIAERRLLIIGVLAAQGEESTLALQLRSALRRGELKPPQLQALATFLTQYVGYPRGARLLKVCNEVAAAATR